MSENLLLGCSVTVHDSLFSTPLRCGAESVVATFHLLTTEPYEIKGKISDATKHRSTKLTKHHPTPLSTPPQTMMSTQTIMALSPNECHKEGPFSSSPYFNIFRFYLIRTSSLMRHHGTLLIGILAIIIPTFIRLRRIFISTLQQNLDGPIETLIQKKVNAPQTADISHK